MMSRLLQFLHYYWLMILAFSVLVLVALYFLLRLMWHTDYTDVIYPLFLISTAWIGWGLSLFLLPAIGLFLIFVLYQLLKLPTKLEKATRGIAGIVALGVPLLLFLGWSETYTDENFYHVSSLHLNDRSYQLTEHTDLDDNSLPFFTYLLYECDSVGLVCDLVHETEPYSNSWRFKQAISLKYEFSDDSIALLIDGVVIYDYQPNG